MNGLNNEPDCAMFARKQAAKIRTSCTVRMWNVLTGTVIQRGKSVRRSQIGSPIMGVLILSVLLGSLSGCAMPEWFRGEGLDGPNADLGSGLRSNTGNGPWGTGMDERARQIEHNLGYRN